MRTQPAELSSHIAAQLRAEARQRAQAADGDPGLPAGVVARLYPVDHQLQKLARWHPEVPRAQLGRDELADLGPGPARGPSRHCLPGLPTAILAVPALPSCGPEVAVHAGGANPAGPGGSGPDC